ncbi:28693_t:CDS:1, partial [Racocetra persica]
AEGKNYFEIPFGYIFDLATFVNGHRNLFKISKKFNNAKKRTPLCNYPTNPTILEYWNSSTEESSIVGADIMSLVNDMIVRKGAYSTYTNKIGQIFQVNLIEPMLSANSNINASPLIIDCLESVYERYNSMKATKIFDPTSINVSDPFPNLLDVLNKDASAPSTSNIIAIPSKLDESDLENLNNIKLLVTYISMLSSIDVYNKKSEWDITNVNEVLDHMNKMANSTFLYITRNLTTILTQ